MFYADTLVLYITILKELYGLSRSDYNVAYKHSVDLDVVFGSIVYNLAIVNKRQNFLIW